MSRDAHRKALIERNREYAHLKRRDPVMWQSLTDAEQDAYSAGFTDGTALALKRTLDARYVPAED